MPSEFRENLSAVAAFIKETGNVTTTLAAIVGGLGTVLVLSLNGVEPGAWAIAVISGTTGLGIAYDPSKSSIIQQQFQRPVDNVAVGTPTSGNMSNFSETTFTPPSDTYYEQPQTDYYIREEGANEDEWLDPTEAAQRMRDDMSRSSVVRPQ